MLNTVSIMGRLTADPELKHTPSNTAVTAFTVAVPRAYVAKCTERVSDFIECVAWRSTAEHIAKYYRKGQMIAVKGQLQTRSYTDKNNVKRKATEILVEGAYFCESKKDNSHQSVEPSAEVEYTDYTPIDDSDEDLPF